MNKLIKTLSRATLLVMAQIVAFIFKSYFNNKSIWIVSEKKTEARDNGYHFFKYLIRNHPELKVYYVIKKGSPDERKVRGIGRVIEYDSLFHCILFFSAKYRVCSQIHGVRPFEEYSGLSKIYFYRRKDQRQINLKHGISKDLLGSFDFRKIGFDLMICCVKREYDFIKREFNYPDKNITLSGFCRYDALHEDIKRDKIILIMPTFRSWLRTDDSSKPCASKAEQDIFIKSDYYMFYSTLLSDTNLLEKVKSCGYKIVFYLHYTFQPYRTVFEYLSNESVIIAGRSEYDVQDLLKRSSLLVTDFSSVLFDFSYMRKPSVYCQFDEEQYRTSHYKEGFFSYKNDGFGPITHTVAETVNCISDLLESNMKVPDEYKKRIDDFFVPNDSNNCERVYNAILKLN